MTESGWDRESTPFHEGERELHERVGRLVHMEQIGRRILRPYILDEHRMFYKQLPYIILGSIDEQGWPWASILFGNPGFVSTPNNKLISIVSKVTRGDPLAKNLRAGAPVSLVGIELHSRRRNRINGVVRSVTGAEIQVDVVQSYGNCPKYIHTRDLEFLHDPEESRQCQVVPLCRLDEPSMDIIKAADTLFVASHNPKDDPRNTGGVDVNHRGGLSGFVKVEGDTLTVPDFRGNYSFNTLGNFLVNPKGGLLFIDFRSGDLLQLTGTVELLWEKTPELEAFDGAERAWRLKVDHGNRLVAASPARWQNGEPSPMSLSTGQWDTA